MVRNKEKGFPQPIKRVEPKAKAKNAPLRANGTINTAPQERMRRSGIEE